MSLDKILANTRTLLAQNGMGLQSKVRDIYGKVLGNETSVYSIFPERVKAIQEMSGVPVPETLVQAAYERLVSNNVGYNRHTDEMYTSDSVMRALVEVTGYQPKIKPEVVQQAYKRLIDALPFHESVEIEASWNELEELTGIKASEETVQNGYIGFLNDHLADRLSGGYGSAWRHESGKAFRWLRNRTGIALGNRVEEELQEIYKGMMSTNPFDGKVEAVVRLVKNTGIIPQEETVQKMYQSIFDNENEGLIPLLVEATGIKFSIPEEVVQKRFQKYLESGDRGFLSYIPPLVEATGIKPCFEELEVQNLAKKLLEDGKPEKYLMLKEITGISLPKEEENKAFVYGLYHAHQWREMATKNS